MCCVLGTLGIFGIDTTLSFTELLLVVPSFAFRLPDRDAFFSPSGLASSAVLPSGLACVGAAGTPPSATPLEPSAGLDGFEEEFRLW